MEWNKFEHGKLFKWKFGRKENRRIYMNFHFLNFDLGDFYKFNTAIFFLISNDFFFLNEVAKIENII